MVVYSRLQRRSGLSLVEFLTAATIMSLIAVAIGSVTLAVRQLSSHAGGVSETLQHARVVQEYFRRTVSAAHASRDFPGVLVWTESDGTATFPDTLVVWSPVSTPAAPEGLPLFSELVVFCSHPIRPNELVMMTDRADRRSVPPLSDLSAWQSELDAFKQNNADTAIVLTSLLRVADVNPGGVGTRRLRPALRFFAEQRPDNNQFAHFEAGQIEWNQLDWPLGLYNSQTGVVRTRCNLEFQLTVPDSEPEETLVFFDAAAVSFIVENRSSGTAMSTVPTTTPP